MTKQQCYCMKWAVAFIADHCLLLKPFPKQQFLDSSNPKEFSDDNFKFVENGRKLSKRVENIGKRRHSAFPTVFSRDLYCRHVKTRTCLVKG